MKKLVFSVIGAGIMFSCTSNSTTTSDSKPIGYSPDKHGCNSAAGQSWSELRQDCIQIFNEGKRLNPVQKSDDNSAVISAFALLNSDSTKAEIFIADLPNLILNKTQDGVFSNGTYRYENKTASLYKGNTLIYKG